ncbi:hypothetical protein PAXINDRAFT_157582 [Paxillus involutus ATCC 200175]|uniref:Retrotransposon gag domain-containing protein n=1 Tax=Paxillus involutus ATCC 200175 TaxID=664439 RepID=A0A0C9TRS6_PAXIN|nr:hypothetical protein PAXINDRAFT_157582 [Paxillus involutus ATCC 200175]
MSTAVSSASVDLLPNQKQFFIEPGETGDEPQTSDSDREEGEWKTVAHRKRHAANSLGETSPRNESILLESETAKMVREAEKRLTREEQSRIRGQKEAEQQARGDESSTSRGEGPSNSKGKQPDPGNWGGLDLSDAELDPEAQKQALKVWNDTRAWSHAQGYGTADQVQPSSASDSGDETPSSRVMNRFVASKEKAKIIARYEKRLRKKLRKLKEKSAVETVRTKQERPKAPGKPEKPGKPSSPGTDRNPVLGIIDNALKQARGKEPRRSVSRVMEPVQQIAPKSYIGQALDRVGRVKKRPTARSSDPSSSSSSSDSSEDSDQSTDSTDTESTKSESDSSSGGLSSSTDSDGSGSTPRRRKVAKRRHHPKSKRRARKRSGSQKRRSTKRRLGRHRSKSPRSHKSGHGKLRPIAPNTYDGSADSRAFHCFVTEGTAYVEAGQVKDWEQVFILSHYLKGRAHEFYVREVSADPYRWRLHEFFLEMFNACFPINYRTKQREKLKKSFQNERTVRDYVSELTELWNLIGDISD